MPEPLSVHEVAVDAETTIQVRRHGNPDGPRLVLSHGNGMAIDLYYPFWSLLLDDFDLVMYDLRNHGWNRVSSLADHNVPTLISDHDLILEAIGREWGEKAQVGVFHSVSALVTLLSPTRGRRYSAPGALRSSHLQTGPQATGNLRSPPPRLPVSPAAARRGSSGERTLPRFFPCCPSCGGSSLAPST